jgi:hypothetical protein
MQQAKDMREFWRIFIKCFSESYMVKKIKYFFIRINQDEKRGLLSQWIRILSN